MRATHIIRGLTCLVALGAASCGDNPAGLGRDGTGELTASGAVSASGGGMAFFQSVTSGGTSVFQIAVVPSVLSDDDVTWQLQIVRYAERPAPGTYELTELSTSSPNPTANFFYDNGSDLEMFTATSGQLVIVSSSSTSVRGTFTFTATSTASSARTVTVEGSFSARCPPGSTCQ